jgi:aryl-alcohol dehydrogenase-like predicted oxidoreductase
VTSKLPPIPDGHTALRGWVEESIRTSLSRLGVSALHAILLHNPADILSDPGDELYESLQLAKRRGLVRKIGVSVYGPEDLDALWRRYTFDLVQAPFSIMDRRLQTSGWLSRLHRDGVETHVRSVFLQGLLLMDAERRPARFGKWNALWREWHEWLASQSLSPLEACLGFVCSQADIDRVIVGVDSEAHLQEIVAAAHGPTVAPPAGLACDDLDLVNPSRWNVQ